MKTWFLLAQEKSSSKLLQMKIAQPRETPIIKANPDTSSTKQANNLPSKFVVSWKEKYPTPQKGHTWRTWKIKIILMDSLLTTESYFLLESILSWWEIFHSACTYVTLIFEPISQQGIDTEDLRRAATGILKKSKQVNLVFHAEWVGFFYFGYSPALQNSKMQSQGWWKLKPVQKTLSIQQDEFHYNLPKQLPLSFQLPKHYPT
jgi:hypothetical protein